MRIQYANRDSNIISKMKGTYKEYRAQQEAVKRKLKPTVGKDHGSKRQAVEKDLPNNILFVENLPAETQQSQVQMLFEKFEGFREVRIVSGKGEIAFVEFESEGRASDAKKALDNFKMSESHYMKVTFAKK